MIILTLFTYSTKIRFTVCQSIVLCAQCYIYIYIRRCVQSAEGGDVMFKTGGINRKMSGRAFYISESDPASHF